MIRVVLLLPLRPATFSLNGYGSFSRRRLALIVLVIVVAVYYIACLFYLLLVIVLGDYGGGSRRLLLVVVVVRLSLSWPETYDPPKSKTERPPPTADVAALESHTNMCPHL